jgi:ACS family glucarate transporter-like MFS transporter
MTRDRSTPRWAIVAILAGLGLVSYLTRMNLSVAAKFMMPELNLTEIQMGQVFSAFMVGYTVCQIPAGLLADWLGPRKVLVTAVLGWGVITVLTGIIPGTLVMVGTPALVALILLRLILGALQSPTYPAGAREMQAWFGPHERAVGFGIIIAGTMLGSAVTPPIVASLMVAIGWRASFYWATILPLIIAWLCWRYLTKMGADGGAGSAAPGRLELSGARQIAGELWIVLRQRSLLYLFSSYFLLGCLWYLFIFWFFLYLVDVRGFSVLRGGVFASLPFFAATITSPLGGAIADRLSRTRGTFNGKRIVAVIAFTGAAVCLVGGATATSAYVAIGFLSLALGLIEGTEGLFWAGAVEIGGSRAGAASGALNMSNNLGGIVAGAVTPILADKVGWIAVLTTAGALSLLAGVLWFGVRPPVGDPQDVSTASIAA